MSACEPATFGRSGEDVMDESYRKAGKLDVSRFATPFVPERTDLVRIVPEFLLEGEDNKTAVEMELYKLNIYGKFSTLRQGLVSDMQLYRRRLFLQSTRRHSSQ